MKRRRIGRGAFNAMLRDMVAGLSHETLTAALTEIRAHDDRWYLPDGIAPQYMPAATSDAEIDIDAADFDEYVDALRAQEPPEGAPDSMTIEVSDGTRTETVRVRGRLAGTWTCIEGKVT